MKYWFLGVSMASLIGISLFAHAQEIAKKTRIGNLVREQLELDLSFAKLKERMATEGIQGEEARNLMGEWLEETREQSEKLRQAAQEERKALRAEIPIPQLPDQVPVLEGSDPTDFLEAANDYFGQAMQAISYQAETPEEGEEVRQSFGRFREEPINQRLEKEMREAEILLEAVREDVPPLSAEEIAAMSGEEKIREEIYAKQYEVTREPLKEGEELRDRMALIQDFVDEKQDELNILHELSLVEMIQLEVRELETQLNDER